MGRLGSYNFGFRLCFPYGLKIRPNKKGRRVKTASFDLKARRAGFPAYPASHLKCDEFISPDNAGKRM